LGNEVQLVSYRLVAFGHVDQPGLERLPDSTKASEQPLKGHREVDFDARGTHRATIWDRQQLRTGDSFEGPAIIEEPASTTIVFPGQSVEVDDYGNLHVQVRHGGG
jgi:N-methylhydantoinase A